MLESLGIDRATDGKRWRIAFLAINASYAHTNLADWCLQAAVGPLARSWVTIEALSREDPVAVLERVTAAAPDVLLASLYLFNRELVRTVLRAWKALNPTGWVIIGGLECLGDNRELVGRGQGVDVVVRGEGEAALPALLRAGRNEESWRDIAGACFLLDERYHDGGMAERLPPEQLPSPYAADRPGWRKPFAQLETSRGCGNRCAFCTSSLSGGTRWFPLTRVRQDLDGIRRLGVHGVRIVDRTFNESPRRCVERLRLFETEYADMRFHLEIDPARLTPAVLEQLARSRPDALHLEVGVQSLSPAVYRAVGRRSDPMRTLEGLRALAKLRNVELHVDLMAGLPEGTLEGLYEDLRTLAALGPAEIQLEVVKLLPGTPLARQATALGLVAQPDPPYAVLKTPTMSFEEMRMAAALSRAVDRFYNVPALREITSRASRELDGFWPALCGRLVSRGALTDCPGLEERFRMLDRVLNELGSPLVSRVRYEWLRQGLSPREPFCCARPWRGRIPEEAELVEGVATQRPGRMWQADLDEPYLFVWTNSRRPSAVFRLAPP